MNKKKKKIASECMFESFNVAKQQSSVERNGVGQDDLYIPIILLFSMFFFLFSFFYIVVVFLLLLFIDFFFSIEFRYDICPIRD